MKLMKRTFFGHILIRLIADAAHGIGQPHHQGNPRAAWHGRGIRGTAPRARLSKRQPVTMDVRQYRQARGFLHLGHRFHISLPFLRFQRMCLVEYSHFRFLEQNKDKRFVGVV
ncbi:hypothetical protein AVEN_20335-1 [Araneus ventricosus]|uniref:Secreted protein n=1 Tax=Araneus ventricosus TaxID=182803 RepID=A0A4Y2IRQ6_ARAVE|nr:hypothetical protein AVEN_20335-1 [Araneus ventricosus]